MTSYEFTLEIEVLDMQGKIRTIFRKSILKIMERKEQIFLQIFLTIFLMNVVSQLIATIKKK